MTFFDKLLQFLGLSTKTTEEGTAQPVEQVSINIEVPDEETPVTVAGESTADKPEGGAGKLAKEVAADLGIVFKGTDNLNTRVVNAAALAIGLVKPNTEGEKSREYETRRYSSEEKSKIRAEIETNSQLVDEEKNVRMYANTAFRFLTR